MIIRAAAINEDIEGMSSVFFGGKGFKQFYGKYVLNLRIKADFTVFRHSIFHQNCIPGRIGWRRLGKM